jgi:peptidoglycan/LPS O-acetylase OafA/YrhL
LRAVAVGLVLLSHAGVGVARGGYIGVDVFFVVSGFLITRLLVAELDRQGRVSLARFYARRVKRLMPQAVLAIAAVAAVVPLVLSPVRAATVAGDVVASGLYGMNWRLSGEAVDYFSTAQDGPLDHFWSLAVEEQFYAVWPLLLLVAARVRRRPALAVGAVGVASLAYAVHATAAAPEQAYFSSFARAWELAAGGLLALVPAQRLPTGRCAAALAWAGAAAIAVATVTFGPATRVPGLPALLPVAGALLLIATAAGPAKVLALRPFQAVGRRSYALYVWHWPVLVLAAAAWGPLSTPQALAATLASLVPALVTHRWVEEPIRRSRLHVRRPAATLAAAVAGSALAVVSGMVLTESLASPPALAAGKAEGAPQLQRTRRIQAAATALRPRPVDAAADRGRVFYDGCLAEERATTSRPCVYGVRRARTTAVLFGDSHAMQYFPALQRVALRRRWRLVVLTKSGCPPPAVRVVYTLSGRSYAECDAWREYALRRIERVERPALVVAAASAHYTVVQGGRRLTGTAGTRAVAAAYAPVLERLRAAVPEVAVLTDAPRPPLDVPDCVSRSMKRLRRCAFPRDEAVAAAQTVKAGAARAAGVRILDPTDEFCLADLCPAVIGDVLVYRNSGHVTASYVETLTGWLGRHLPRK